MCACLYMALEPDGSGRAPHPAPHPWGCPTEGSCPALADLQLFSSHPVPQVSKAWGGREPSSCSVHSTER